MTECEDYELVTCIESIHFVLVFDVLVAEIFSFFN